jgi:threonine dehydratase
MPATEVTFEDVQRAAERIKGIAQRTPVMTSHAFNEKSGVNAVFKCENMQKGGAFKIRGAANFLYSIPKNELPRGVVAYSSGNHAQAVAIAAKSVGTPATLLMPQDAPRSKVEATSSHGPRIIRFDRFKEDRDLIGTKISEETGAWLVPPYDHPWTMAGAGTTALEFLEQAPDLDALVVCIGGGGLIAGCAIAAKHIKPSIRIFGVEPANASDTYQSYEAGKRVKISAPDTIADGLRSPSPGELTFPIIQKHVEQIVLVSEDEIRATVKFLLTRMKILVEPSGAVAAAAVMFGKLPAGLGRVGIVLSGGNVDLDQLAGF